jgi:ABC-type antimicrobial peptide transport system permease subunit
MDLVIRRTSDPAALTRSVRSQVQAMDRSLTFYDVHTLQAQVARTLATRHLTNQLLLSFAVTAPLLAAIGIYGVMALGVADRVHEFGIRLALGAAPADVLRLLFRQGLRLVALGVTIGAAASLALTRTIAALLFGVKPFDPITFAVVAFVIATVSLPATSQPAAPQRSTRSPRYDTSRGALDPRQTDRRRHPRSTRLWACWSTEAPSSQLTR